MEYPAGCPGAQVWVKPSEATPTGYALPAGSARFPAQLPRAGAATQSARAGAGAPPRGRSQPMRLRKWPARATGPFILAPPRGAARTGRRAGGRGLAAGPLGGGNLESLFWRWLTRLARSAGEHGGYGR